MAADPDKDIPALKRPKLDVRGKRRSRPTLLDRGLTTDQKLRSATIGKLELQKALSSRLSLKKPTLDVRGFLASPRFRLKGLASDTPGAFILERLALADRGTSENTLWMPYERLPDVPYVPNAQKEEITLRQDATRMVSTKQKIFKTAAENGSTLENAHLFLAVAMQETNKLAADYPFGDVYPAKIPLALTKPKLDVKGLEHIPRFKLSVTSPLGERPKVEDFFPQPKKDDAANFGIYKMNWYMIKQCDKAKELIRKEQKARGIAPGSKADWNIEKIVGKQINSDPQLATEILIQAMNKWSTDPPDPENPQPGNFWAGHRAGGSGLDNLPGTDWKDIRRYYLSVQEIKYACDQDPYNIWKSNIRYWVDVPGI